MIKANMYFGLGGGEGLILLIYRSEIEDHRTTQAPQSTLSIHSIINITELIRNHVIFKRYKHTEGMKY